MQYLKWLSGDKVMASKNIVLFFFFIPDMRSIADHFELEKKKYSKDYYTWNNCWMIPCLTYSSVIYKTVPWSELNCPLYCPQEHNYDYSP